ncbi:snare associated Golgi protein-domain-containing protein, partial [Paraphysoderma sedebokerense]
SSIVTKVQKLNVAGDVIIFLILTAACFPPVFIYAIFAIMGGFVYGFPFGFLLVVTASTLGSITCFMLSRSLLRDHFNRLASRYTFLLRANQVIDKKGFWILLIVRLGPYPFSIVSVLAAQTSISTWKFALATFLSTPRFLAFVYIGSTLTSL